MALVPRFIGGEEILVESCKAGEVHLPREIAEGIEQSSDDGITITNIIRRLCRSAYHPMVVGWELLDRCNLRCPFCYITGHSSEPMVYLKEAKPVLDDLLAKGMLHVTLTGGEPTVHPDFQAIYTYLKEKGCLVEFYTNGCFDERRILPLLDDLPPYLVEVSIYGSTQEDFEASTGTSGSIDFRKPLDNILELQRRGHRLVAKTHLNTRTLPAMRGIESWCAEQGIPHFKASEVLDAYDGTSLQSFQIASGGIRDSLGIRDGWGDSPSAFREPFPCKVKTSALFITAGFALQPCSEFRLSDARFDLRGNGLGDALKGMRAFVDYHSANPLRVCNESQPHASCNMCAARAFPIRDAEGAISGFMAPG